MVNRRTVEPGARSESRSGPDNGRVGWGIGLIAVAAAFSVGAHLYAAQRSGDLGIIYIGAVAIGVIQILRGWTPASGYWRAGAVTAVVLIASFTVWNFLQGEQAEEAFVSAFNSVEVGDCVDGDGLVVSCASADALNTVTHVHHFADDEPYPNFDDFDGCPGMFLYPSRGSWNHGNRTLICVE